MAYVSKAAVAHCQAIKSAQIRCTYTANNLINAYTRCRDFAAALKLFDEMPNRDTASWNTVIAGYVNSRNFQSAWDFLKSMKQHGFLFDGYTFGSILKGVATNGFLSVGQLVHSDIVKMGYDANVYSASALVDMYTKCGRMEDANKVFCHMPERNTVSWNALIAGYAEIGDCRSCVRLLEEMERECVLLDDGTFCPLLTLLDDQEFFGLAMQLHAKILKCGLDFENMVCNALISAYSNCGSIEDAEKVFDGSDSCRDLITWNSMLAAYIEYDQGMEAFQLFLDMERLGLETDIYTFTSIISACYEITEKRQGKCLHALVIKRGLENVTSIANALIAMYLKSNGSCMDDAMSVFEFLDVKDSISWNIILTGLSQNALSEDSFKIFEEMRSRQLEMDHYAFAAVLRSCSDLASFRLGQQTHALTLKTGVNVYEYVTSALIFMYSKCGHIEDAWKSFEESPKETSISWNSIMFAYAQHGLGEVALDLFSSMTKRKVNPDHVTFVAVLTACSHIGLVDEGRGFLNSMEADYGIPPRMEHYACAIDLFGRAGHLEEAKELIRGMPFQPDSMVWKTLLGACRMCGDLELASEVAHHLLELEPGEHCTYVLLTDMFGKLKLWNEIAGVKRLMRERGVKKIPGLSWIEVKNESQKLLLEPSFRRDEEAEVGVSGKDLSFSCSLALYPPLDTVIAILQIFTLTSFEFYLLIVKTCMRRGVSGGVTHCLQVPEDVKEMLRTELLGKRFGNAMRNVGELNEPNLPLKRNRQDSPARLDKQDSIQNSGNVIAPVVPRGRVDSPAEGSGVGVNDSSLRKAQKSIGRILIEFDCCCICLKEEGFICLVTFFSDPEVSCDLCCCIIPALKLKKGGRRSSLTPTKDGGTRLTLIVGSSVISRVKSRIQFQANTIGLGSFLYKYNLVALEMDEQWDFQRDWEVRISHIPREFNNVADSLAKHVRIKRCDWIKFEKPPSEVMENLVANWSSWRDRS
nr:putative pentatricopeptide repeat-containing protein At3g25970 [Ipomoea trifida]